MVDVGNDEKGVSVIKENADNMLNKHGYKEIWGIRDFFPEKIENKVKMITAINRVINNSQRISVILVIMEIEAWFLADYNIFSKINKKLTPDYIKEKIGIDLINDDPEVKYNHPSVVINNILKLADQKYTKNKGQIHKIVNSIDYDFLCLDVKQTSKIKAFFLFLKKLHAVL